jgi:hypothetical protein
MNCVALFLAIPIQSTSNVSLKYPDIARLHLSFSCLEVTDYFGRIQCFRIKWIRTYFGRHRANWYAVAAIAVPFAYSPAMALMPAAIATKRSTRRKKQSNRP